MSEFNLKILGCGSATPSLRHNPSCQIVQLRGTQFMIDCGEGSQLQMRRMKIPFGTLRHIFISHLHGDHMLGLPGLLSTLALHDIKSTVHVYIHPDGIDWLKNFMRISRHHSTLDIVFHPILPEHAELYSDKHITIESFPLKHGVPCTGFIFREKPKPRKMLGDMANFYNVPIYLRQEIKNGADFVTSDGTVIPNSRLTTDPDPSASYAFCSDTSFSQSVIDSVRGVTTIYHEATYADDKIATAADRGHSTARQAAVVARDAGAKQLVIGHFSKSYPDEKLHLAQAREVFDNVIVANEGMTIDLQI